MRLLRMNEIVKVLPSYKKFNSYMDDIKNRISPIMLSGLTDSGKTHFAYATGFYSERPICIITYNEMQAKKLISDLSYFSSEVAYFPRREILAYDYIAESTDIRNQRISCLNKIHDKKAKVVVTTIEAVMQKIILKKNLYKNLLSFKNGQTLNLTQVKEDLISLGYERVEMVEGSAQFSIRGGIVDISLTEKKGVRLELWGDDIDSIRNFDIMTQRSTKKLEKIKIYPATEFILEDDLVNITDKIEKIKGHDPEDVEMIREGNYLSKVDKYFESFYEESCTLMDYLGEDYCLFIDEASKLKARSENILKDTKNVIESLIEKKKIVLSSLEILGDFDAFLEKIKDLQTNSPVSACIRVRWKTRASAPDGHS